MTSGFVSFLKAFGQDVVKAGKAVLGVPTTVIQLAQNVPQAVDSFKSIVDIVKQGEAMFAAAGQQTNGPAKLAAVTPYVSSIVQDVEVIGGTKLGSIIQDEAGFNAGVTNLINAVVQILNSLKPTAAAPAPTTT